jgi:hypothetical protein
MLGLNCQAFFALRIQVNLVIFTYTFSYVMLESRKVPMAYKEKRGLQRSKLSKNITFETQSVGNRPS